MEIETHNQFKGGQKLTWEVPRLINLASRIEPTRIQIGSLKEFDSVYWFDEEQTPTCRAVVEHFKRILAADTTVPIMLSEGGLVMDGMHRVCKAMLDGNTTIMARQFVTDPEPDRREPQTI